MLFGGIFEPENKDVIGFGSIILACSSCVAALLLDIFERLCYISVVLYGTCTSPPLSRL